MPPIVERPDLLQYMALMPDLAPGTKAYTMGECRILVSLEPEGWHLSISCERRYPDWDEIAEARYRLLPLDHTFAMLLPPPEEYVNVSPNVFHLHDLGRESKIIVPGR